MENVEDNENIVLKPSDFVHLHNHTHYSLLDGLTKIPELVQFVKEKGMEAVAVTDHGTMSGLVELYKTCKDEGIKPILGLEAYVAARNLEDRDPAHDKQRFHIIQPEPLGQALPLLPHPQHRSIPHSSSGTS